MVRRCSLWYLPVLLGAFVFHSRNWDMQAEDNAIAALRRKLASVCVHEVGWSGRSQVAVTSGGGDEQVGDTGCV